MIRPIVLVGQVNNCYHPLSCYRYDFRGETYACSAWYAVESADKLGATAGRNQRWFQAQIWDEDFNWRTPGQCKRWGSSRVGYQLRNLPNNWGRLPASVLGGVTQLSLHGSALSSVLSPAQELAMLVCTIGSGVEERMKEAKSTEHLHTGLARPL